MLASTEAARRSGSEEAATLREHIHPLTQDMMPSLPNQDTLHPASCASHGTAVQVCSKSEVAALYTGS